jgi:hypothetical protein
MFSLVKEHWLVSLILVFIYAVWATPTIASFHQLLKKRSRLWLFETSFDQENKFLRFFLIDPNRILQFLLRLAFLLLGLPVAPILWFLVKSHEEAEKKRLALEKEEVASGERSRRLEEDNRRKILRKLWLEKNPPKVYAHTINGITAVVRPAD